MVMTEIFSPSCGWIGIGKLAKVMWAFENIFLLSGPGLGQPWEIPSILEFAFNFLVREGEDISYSVISNIRLRKISCVASAIKLMRLMTRKLSPTQCRKTLKVFLFD